MMGMEAELTGLVMFAGVIVRTHTDMIEAAITASLPPWTEVIVS